MGHVSSNSIKNYVSYYIPRQAAASGDCMSFGLFARILERQSCILYKKYAFQSSQPYSTIFSPPKRRSIDYKAFENLKTTMLYVLRSAVGKEHGFGNRDDGYVSVKRLVSAFPFSVCVVFPEHLYLA